MSDSNILDKSMRSVFVGNIPYEATEEKLKDIFNEVGPVLSFKLVYDRETGKPKGYGFCEYKDQETALSAMRNLNGYEIGGRSLRVDNACTEKSRLEMQSLLAGPPVDNTYGDPVEADKAPEEISKAVASLPPEQMFELMKQMKLCIQNNPTEGKQMLLQNPQLAYALLQAQVVMRIVDPQVAVTMLHKINPTMTPLMPSTESSRVAPTPVVAPVQAPPRSVPVHELPAPPMPPRVATHPPAPTPHAAQFIGQDMDMRAIDPRGPGMDTRGTPMDPRGTGLDPRAGVMDPSMRPASMDPRGMDHRVGVMDPRGMDPRSVDPRASGIDPRAAMDPRVAAMDPRVAAMDPRAAAMDPRANVLDSRANAMDPRASLDPRASAMDQRASSLDHRTAGLDPRAAALDPRAATMDPRAAAVDPRTAGMDPRATSADPRAVSLDPRSATMESRANAVDPRAGSADSRASALDRAVSRGDQDLRVPPLAPPPGMHTGFQGEHVPAPASRDPRFQRDPRSGGMLGTRTAPAPVAAPAARPPAQQPPAAFTGTIPSGATDQEKAALIMQVLQLSDEQIAMLPPEQRQSILVLKEQIAKSTQR